MHPVELVTTEVTSGDWRLVQDKYGMWYDPSTGQVYEEITLEEALRREGISLT